ncbi:hypothetical protein Tco_0382277 [Tanacetum coccineum]
MAESSIQNPSSPNLTPKEEPVTLNKPESPNPFLPAIQVEFTFKEISFTTNNEVVLPDSNIWVSTPTGEVRGEIERKKKQALRPWFATIEYNGEIRAKGTLKKSCLPPRWRLLMGKIIQCLGGKTGGLDQISNKDATILYCLENGV